MREQMKIRLLRVDDWAGLYINDTLVMENHELDLFSVITNLVPGADFETVWLDDLDKYNYRCPQTWLPELEEVY